ncbi:DUF4249 domain-containing protein [Bacteroidota bacterium]
MKKFGIIVMFAGLLFYGCEEVIEIDLNSVNPMVVAEGNLMKDSVAQLNLSYTRDYFHKEDPVYITDATVILSDENGITDQLIHVANGFYRGSHLKGQVRTDYTLTIGLEEGEYSGETRLLPEPDFFSITWAPSIFQRPAHAGGSSDTVYNVTLTIQDDTTEVNHYLLNFYTPSSEPRGFYLAIDDKYPLPGNLLQFTTFMFEFYRGDTVGITVQSIDEGAYWFFNQMNDVIGVGPSGFSTPYNPKSNLGEDVLGYFMARSRKDTIVFLR